MGVFNILVFLNSFIICYPWGALPPVRVSPQRILASKLARKFSLKFASAGYRLASAKVRSTWGRLRSGFPPLILALKSYAKMMRGFPLPRLQGNQFWGGERVSQSRRLRGSLASLGSAHLEASPLNGDASPLSNETDVFPVRKGTASLSVVSQGPASARVSRVQRKNAQLDPLATAGELQSLLNRRHTFLNVFQTLRMDEKNLFLTHLNGLATNSAGLNIKLHPFTNLWLNYFNSWRWLR